MTSSSIKRFREYFEDLNRTFLSAPPAQSVRKPILAEVIPVAEGTKYLPPVTEVAEVQKMINSHNSAFRDPALNITKSTYGHLQIKKTVFYTGYIASSADTSRLITEVLNPLLPQGLVEGNDLKYMANCILIIPRPAPKSILDKVGGMGKKVRWQVTGTGNYDNQLWAARVKPIPETEKVYTENRPPCVVLALRKGARPVDAGKIQNWQPLAPNRSMVFDTERNDRSSASPRRYCSLARGGEYEDLAMRNGRQVRDVCKKIIEFLPGLTVTPCYFPSLSPSYSVDSL